MSSEQRRMAGLNINEPSASALPTWWLVFIHELKELWIGGKALFLGFIYTVVLGIVTYVISNGGFSAPHFLFYGFLPERAAARRKALAPLAKLPFTLVFYEAPHRIEESVTDLRAALGGERRIVLAREVTKLFETLHACALAEAGHNFITPDLCWLWGSHAWERREFYRYLLPGTRFQVWFCSVRGSQ